MYIEGVYMHSSIDTANERCYNSVSDTGKLPSIIIPKLFCAGMFCGLEAVAEKILTKQNAVL